MSLTLQLGALAAINLVAGFLMQWYTVVELGAGVATDALFAGMAVPQVVLTVVAGSLSHVIIPLLASKSEDEARRDAWMVAVVSLVVFGLLAIALAATAPWWTRAVAPGFTSEARVLMVRLTRIQLVGMIFTAVAGALWAVHRARQRFVRAELAALAGTAVGWIVLVWGLPRYGVVAAAWVQVLRVVLHAALLMPGMGRFTLHTTTDTLEEAWRRLRPLMTGYAYTKTEPLVDRVISSLAPAGNLSLYYIGQQMALGLMLVSNSALVSPMVSRLARLAHARDWGPFERAYRRTVLVVLVSTASAFVGGLGLAAPALAWYGPNLAAQGTTARSFFWIFAGLGGTFIAGPMADVVRGAFYAKGETRVPVRTDAVIYTLGILVKAGGFVSFGIVGLAVATSLQSVAGTILLMWLLRDRVSRLIASDGALYPGSVAVDASDDGR